MKPVKEMTDAELMERFDVLLSVAATYLEDGAPKTSAARLRAAADVADEISRRREEFLKR